MNTESDWSSENRYQEPVPAEEPQRTARYSWDWPENLAPWWTPPPGLVPPQWGPAAVADGNQPGGEHESTDEPDASYWDDDSTDGELDDQVADLRSTDREVDDEEIADFGSADREPGDRGADREPMDGEPDDAEMADREPMDGEPDDAEMADRELADREPAEAGWAARDLVGDEASGDEETWPGVAPAAGWFLRTPDEDGRDDAAPIQAGLVPWPRRESDSAMTPSSGFPAPAPQNGAGASGGNGSKAAGAWSVSGAGLPAEPVVGATRALWGRPGGPGFQPGRPGPGTRREPVEPSPWQKSQGMWRESGIQWEPRPAESTPPMRPAEGAPPRPAESTPLPRPAEGAPPRPAESTPLPRPAEGATPPRPASRRSTRASSSSRARCRLAGPRCHPRSHRRRAPLPRRQPRQAHFPRLQGRQVHRRVTRDGTPGRDP